MGIKEKYEQSKNKKKKLVEWKIQFFFFRVGGIWHLSSYSSCYCYRAFMSHIRHLGLHNDRYGLFQMRTVAGLPRRSSDVDYV